MTIMSSLNEYILTCFLPIVYKVYLIIVAEGKYMVESAEFVAIHVNLKFSILRFITIIV